MTTHKAFALLYFLLCFCFISTSDAQPCLSENSLANDSYYQLLLDDLPEPNILLVNNYHINRLDQLGPFIDNKPLENQRRHILPRCTRDPPPYDLKKQQPIL